ncbi:hypothetical protein ABNB59_05690 [Paenibacillus larvae]|uniref:Uncharacterized protein n=3 Tax=Paenibacillus larvae TaxID=1464 RepID=V9W632_9BACL|nr:hypothetical protein [Paenibacillus larvae]AHD05384.1 hypothetical protein ERIC2_c15570 [Paenibacillus larvae subsp. larvae DSM 25430]AQR77112.1 hypothetical protein BXP28_06825 [Paenibacillus larvae subsp. larvae]AVF21938.1 hypothetical protein ERICI_02081 [Paenibacillus larvae subsp. larvae]ETK27283.1 hypothetical protein ERIC1_1c07270 [Paenibacillus larvae subsp. larvae DSM 25719]MCY7477963.1 hypothetical protein [Paenibacillus larvae]
MKPLQKRLLLEQIAKRPEYLNGEQRVHLMCKQLLQQNKTNMLAWMDELKSAGIHYSRTFKKYKAGWSRESCR